MYYGADIGRGAVKVAHSRGSIVFPSYLVPSRERDLVSAATDYMEQLVVSINGKEYFAGELARREGGTREFAKDKAGHATRWRRTYTSASAYYGRRPQRKKGDKHPGRVLFFCKKSFTKQRKTEQLGAFASNREL